eukprot:TCONS_00023993-protein
MRSGSNSDEAKSRLVNTSPRKLTPTCGKSHPGVGGMEGVRERLLTEGISTKAANLIVKSRREGTRSSYKLAWGKWVCWCSKQQVDPHEYDLRFVLDFLAHLFQQKYEYSTINLFRSAISAYHKNIDSFDVGKHSKICSLLGGVFNEMPPQPKYAFIWDVEQVLSYIESLPDNEALSDRDLNLKLVPSYSQHLQVDVMRYAS